MSKDLLYTNGVIAAREKYLLKDKIFKLCEADPEDAFARLTESGFGKGAEVSSVYEYEKLVSADEADIDCFIREYSPSLTEAAYLLAPRDFHNAKALVKAYAHSLDAEKMLAPDGLIPVSVILNCIKEGKFAPLGKCLGDAVKKSVELFSEENANVSGADVGVIFEKAQYDYLSRTCAKNPILKKLLTAKADMTNVLTALRSSESEYAEKCYVSGGKLSAKQLSKLFDEDKDRAVRAFADTPYAEFVKKCIDDRQAGLPLTQAEKVAESYEKEYLTAKKYELERNQPFLYYVFRRRAENSNVRILFVCLLAGMKDSDVKKRLRTF